MPNYNDLQELKEKIQSLGNEPEIVKNKNLTLNDPPLPEETSKKDEKIKEDLIQVDTKDLMSDILDDFEQGKFIEDNDGETEDSNEIDTSDLDNLLGDMEEPSEESPVDENQENFDDLDNLLGEAPSELSADEDTIIKTDTSDLDDLLAGVDVGSPAKEEINTEETITPDDADMSDMDALSGDIGEPPADSDEIPVGNDELGDLLGDFSADSEETPVDTSELADSEMSDLDALLGGEDFAPVSESDEIPASDDELNGLLGENTAVPSEMISDDFTGTDDGLGDLLGDFSAESESAPETFPAGDIEETTPSDLDDLLDNGGFTLPSESDESSAGGNELADIFGEEPSKDVPSDFQGDDILEQLGQENEPLSDIQDLGSLLGEDTYLPPLDQASEENADLDMPDEMSRSDLSGKDEIALDALQDISSLDSSTAGIESSDLSQVESGDFGSFDLDKLDSFSDEEISSPENIIPQEELAVMDASFGEIPLELSEEDIKKDQDIELTLTDDERKQIVISLRNLPKEAEIKISKAIVSNKYSNQKLKPLINALIESESPQVIIKYYERITGDTSLSQIEAVKHAGVKFEERQKTFAYLFEKNIVPILSKIMAGAAIFVLIALFIGIVVRPRLIAAGLYKKGKVLIEEKKFEESKEKFYEAYNVHPKYKQVIDYARKYRKNKRYLAAEEMYDLSISMRPYNKEIVLEYADMFREKGRYDRAESKYRGFLKSNEKDIDALLGLAKNYYDWSDEEAGKLNDARETYLDILDIDKNNKDAVFGNLMIHIKKNNYIEVMKHYSYIEDKFGKKVDSEVYTKLAEYLIDTGEVQNVKNILKKASNSLKKGRILPEMEYQNARYNKLLNIYPEERASLLKAKNQIENMKIKDPEKFGSIKYQKLLSRVYNDLGENYELSTRASTDAERYYSQAIITDPSYGRAYYNLANFALNNRPNGYEEAKEYYLDAEKNGFTNDRLNFNLGWLYYRERDYYNAYNRTAGIFNKEPDNSNLKFLIGTIFYRMGKYDLSESLLLETYMHFEDLSAQYYPLDPNEKEGKIILDMIERVGNNLGAVYQKKYEETRKSKYIISATKYYQDSIMAFDKLINRDDSEIDINIDTSAKQPVEGEFTKFRKENAHINLRMVLYPDAGLDEPIIYEEFPLDYSTYM